MLFVMTDDSSGFFGGTLIRKAGEGGAGVMFLEMILKVKFLTHYEVSEQFSLGL